MLPQARWIFPRACAVLGLGVAALLGGCGELETPEARVRAVIVAGEQAAEARDPSALLEHVSPAFRDEHGGGRDELKQTLRGYFVMHPSVHLLTRVESIEFPYRDFARVEVTVGSLGSESAGATGFEFAADVNDVVLELQLEDDGWKVVRAAWGPRRRG